MKRRRESKRKINRSILAYAAGLLASVALIGSAFAAPRLIFEMQDNIRCGEVVLDKMESLDIASFNVGYEPDLYERLLRFAEGLSKGNSYYVAAQDMEPTSEFLDFWISDRGLYQKQLMMWWEEEILPYTVIEYGVQKWKQYVIYGDDFSAGVNFILWYIELANPGTPTLKMLMDGETGEIYGIAMMQTEDTLIKGENLAEILPESWISLIGPEYERTLSDLWCIMTVGYGGVMNDTLIKRAEKCGFYFSSRFDADTESMEGMITMNISFGEGQTDADTEMIKWELSEDQTTLNCFFPYERKGEKEPYELLFSCKMERVMLIRSKYGEGLRPEKFVLGFPDIYELIPEFAESL